MSTADTPDWREPIARAFGYVDGGEVTAGGSMQNDYAWDIADELGAEVEAGHLTMDQAMAKAPAWYAEPQVDAPRDEQEFAERQAQEWHEDVEFEMATQNDDSAEI